MNNIPFYPADILLPDLTRIKGEQWSVVACDQYTSEPDYWKRARALTRGAPSTLSMILPEVYLGESALRVPRINAAMEEMLRGALVEHPAAMIALERTQSDGRLRRGIIGAVDLEQYDYQKGSASMIRATEGTVLERIPPRVAVRRDASLELPHVMLLIDDPKQTAILPVHQSCKDKTPLYDFDLMLGGGHVKGYLLDGDAQKAFCKALQALVTPESMEERYRKEGLAPLLFAVGDGNHSLATAKSCYELVKQALGEEAARNHPARYALCEVVNLHDDALEFEPIYRVVFGCDPHALLADLQDYIKGLSGDAATQSLCWVTCAGEGSMQIPHPRRQLTVGTLQDFLDEYQKTHPGTVIDYIHGEDSLRSLIKDDSTVGFLFEGMRKDELFSTVIFDGALPRKTFSMGHAPDKRYYLECRRIK